MGRKRKGLRLQVCMNSLLVGYLEKASSGAISFQYCDDWLNYKHSMPISISLPCSQKAIKGSKVYNYFENLLPDSLTVRKKIAERVGAQSSDVLDLLSVIGRDCVGALQFLPEGLDLPTKLPQVRGEKVSNQQIESILNDLSIIPLGLGKESSFRISMAGVQEKTALLRIDGNWFRPEGSVPTSHILKKPMGQLVNGIDMTQSVYNEWMCLELCKKLGLKVANSEIVKFGKTYALVVERFDRQWSKDKKILYRLPTEDFCQALGVSTLAKYENEGGPGIAAIMDLLSISNFRKQDQKAFMKAQIVFQLFGAIDGHAKNFSLFLGPGGISMTPIYDVLSAYPALHKRQIERREVKMAMAVGKDRKYRIYDIQRRHWYQTAALANFDKRFLDDIFDELKASLSSLRFTKKELPSNFPTAILESTMKEMNKVKRQLFA